MKPYKNNIARLIFITRARAGYTQTSLAKKMGVKQSAIARIERTGIASIKTLEKFADVFNKNIKISLHRR